jgi:hypothetical protein
MSHQKHDGNPGCGEPPGWQDLGVRILPSHSEQVHPAQQCAWENPRHGPCQDWARPWLASLMSTLLGFLAPHGSVGLQLLLDFGESPISEWDSSYLYILPIFQWVPDASCF